MVAEVTWTPEAIATHLRARYEAQIGTLYRFHDHDDVLLYVGISIAPWNRWRAHRRLKPWWHEVAHITLERYHRDDLRTAEKLAIRTELPRYNIQDVKDADDIHYTPQPVTGDALSLEFQVFEEIYRSLLHGRSPAEYGLPTGTDHAEKGPFRDSKNRQLSLTKKGSYQQKHQSGTERDRYSSVPDTSARTGRAQRLSQSLSVPEQPPGSPR